MCREQKEQLQKLKEFKPDISTQDSPRSQNTSTRPGAFQVNSSYTDNVLVVVPIYVCWTSSDGHIFLWSYPYNLSYLLLRQNNFLVSLNFPKHFLLSPPCLPSMTHQGRWHSRFSSLDCCGIMCKRGELFQNRGVKFTRRPCLSLLKFFQFALLFLLQELSPLWDWKNLRICQSEIEIFQCSMGISLLFTAFIGSSYYLLEYHKVHGNSCLRTSILLWCKYSSTA